MEWTNRGDRPQATSSATPSTTAAPAPKRQGDKGKLFKGLKFATVALLFGVTVLIVALAAFVALGKNDSEGGYVNNKQMQAVFLNGGQVYFGHITNLNNDYMRVADIYYLRVNQQVQPDAKSGQQSQNDISLVKLGCELHGPEDNMLINREQVIFWENLKDDGQVAKAVAEYKKQNPNGQKCDAPQQTNTTPTAPSPTPSTPNTPSNNPNTQR